MISHTSNCWKF